MDDLERRVAEDHRAVAGHDPEPLRAVGVQLEQVGDVGHAVRRAAAGEHDVRAGVEHAAYGVAARPG